MIRSVNLAASFARFSDTWTPKIVGQVNDMHIKLAKLDGEFVWHKHDDADEMFLVTHGRLTIRMRNGDVHLAPGEFTIIPKGVEHLPIASGECHVVLIEPVGTRNTGDVVDERTVENPERLS